MSSNGGSPKDVAEGVSTQRSPLPPFVSRIVTRIREDLEKRFAKYAVALVTALVVGGATAVVHYGADHRRHQLPPVIGLPQAEAEKVLRQAGFKHLDFSQHRHGNEVAGTVVDEQRAPGLQLAKEEIALTVSDGPAP